LNNQVVIVTGELSGETHAASLVEALAANSGLAFSGIGGPVLARAGVRVIYDYKNISIVGISEVLSKLGHILQALRVLKKHLMETMPGLLILVDFPGFNLLLVAGMAKKLGIPVVYFIPPQVWAWHEGRVRKIKANVDLVLSILPFEEAFFRRHGIRVSYVGHPYTQTVRPVHEKARFYEMWDVNPSAPVICLMPGSRQNEARKHMPVLLEVLDRLDRDLGKYTVLLPVADTLDAGFFAPFVDRRNNVRLIKGFAHDCLAHSHAALIASGSATLEAAILGVPSVVIYKVSTLSYLIARLVTKVRYISLPNLIAGEEVFPEFIQSLDPEEIAKAMISMLNNDGPAVREKLERIKNGLAASGPDSYQIAGREILRFLEYKYGPLSTTA
jgi:lipid-A-disaccharide synthase